MLRQRILSALVLAPIALVASWAGGWAFAVLAAVAAILMAWEWTRLSLGAFGLNGWILAIQGMAVSFCAVFFPLIALGLIVLGALVAPLPSRNAGKSVWWPVMGAIYIGIPVFSLVWLRGQSDGLPMLLWILLLVWATDIGAYAVGRLVGGPKLLPRISPKKTWSGLGGGIASAAIVGGAMMACSGGNTRETLCLAIFSGLLAVIAQAGDLSESWVKRHVGVKDSSNIIPGHGGVLDRLDGLLAAAPVAVLAYWLLGGGFFQWK